MLSIKRLCVNHTVARHVLRCGSSAGFSLPAPAHRRPFSSAATTSTSAHSTQPIQWMRAASDTLVTSARPITPSDASHDGIAKVSTLAAAARGPLTLPPGRHYSFVDRHNRISSINASLFRHHKYDFLFLSSVLHAHVRSRGSHSLHRPDAGWGLHLACSFRLLILSMDSCTKVQPSFLPLVFGA
jgi:hypothetical protein